MNAGDGVTEAQAMAIARRAKMPGSVRPTPAPFPWAEGVWTVGVTGTNGKTSTTSLLSHALRSSPGSVLTKTTIECRIDDEIVEVSRDLRGYLEAFRRLVEKGGRRAAVEVTSNALAHGYAKFWPFQVGVFTNLSRDHVSAHGSWEHYLGSKAQLFVHLPDHGAAVLNAADETTLLLDQIIPAPVKRYWYAGGTRGAPLHSTDLAATSAVVHPDGTDFELAPSDLAEAVGRSLKIPFVGDVYVENALAAVLAALHSGVEPERIATLLATWPAVRGRFQVVARSPLVVVDFAHTPDALQQLCRTARSIVGEGKVIVVFGAGGGRDKEKRGQMGETVGQYADHALITNDNPRHEDPKMIAQVLEEGCRRGGRTKATVCLDRAQAIERAIELAGSRDIVLVAGKGHETGQESNGEIRPFSDVETIERLVAGARKEAFGLTGGSTTKE